MSSSRTVRFVQNMACTAAYQITAMIMGFITPRLMILYYGSEVNGLIVSVTEFLTYFKMVEAGLAAAAIAALYKPLADGDKDVVSGIVSAARLFYRKAGFLFCGLTVLFAIVYPFVVPVCDINGLQMSALSEMLLILSMGIAGALEFFTLSRYRVLLTADQKTYVVSLTSMSSLLLSTALIVVLPYLGAEVTVVRLAASLTILLRSVILSRYTAKRYPDVNPEAKPDRSALGKRWDALYVELTEVFQQGAGVILTSLITRDASILSVYGLYHMVTVGLWGILKMGTTGIYSIFGNLLVSGDKPGFQKAYRDFECLYHTVGSVLFGAAAVLIVPFVTLYTHGVEDVNYTVPAIGLLMIVEALSNQCKMPMDLMISSSGMFREVRWHCVAQVATTVVLGTALGIAGLSYGVEASVCGVLLGVILGNLVRAAFQLRFVPKSITGLPWKDSLRRMLRLALTVAVIAAPFLLWVSPPRRFYTWVMYAVVLVIYASVVSLASAWLFDREALRSLLGRVGFMVGNITKKNPASR
ncbi:MAG: hypothetical protein PHI98_13015 [Eubacteriales bacterium]|nr:hypothetical protein [Eubacteriales bacterium]